MAIATLIAAGRLDDRLIDRALGALREIDPKAGFRDLDRRGRCGRPACCTATRRRSVGRSTVCTASTSSFSPRRTAFKRLLVADMDSTIVGQECLDELADFAGLKREIAEITERAMQGKLDFKAALRERVAMLSGLDEEAISRCLAERVVPNPGAATLVRTMRVGGA